MATVELTTPPKVTPRLALTLTCTATLPDSVDTEVKGVVTWDTPSGIVETHTERYTLYETPTDESHTHQFSLYISSFSP